MSLRWWSSCRTSAGRVREINEDAYLDMPDIGMWLVADGMGGLSKGDLASRLVVESLSNLPCPTSMNNFAFLVKQRLVEANHRVQEMASKFGAYQIMGSTVVTLLVFQRQCLCIWAGDSRAYLLRNGQLVQISRDHSLAEELVARGELKREEASHHPSSHRITRAVGTQQELILDERQFELCDGDAVLMCTDGLNKEVSDQEITLVLDSFECEEASQELLDLSLERGARDNVTVAIIQFEAITGFGDSIMDKMASHQTLIPGTSDFRPVSGQISL